MKRLSLILICISLFTLLSGCANEPVKEFLVSALCFENDNGNILASAEYISVSDADTNSGYSAKTVSASADKVTKAVSRLSSKMTKKLMFEHCAVIMLGENLNSSQIGEIFDFLRISGISFSAELVCVENSSVLRAETDYTSSVGYALSSLLKNRGESFGYGVHIRMYEISTARKQEENIFAIPFVALNDRKLSAEDMMLYIDDAKKLKLDMKESIFYAMARNVYEGGRVETEERTVTLNSVKVKPIKTTNKTLTLETNLKNAEIKTELELFLNQMLDKGINLLGEKDIHNITIKRGNP